MRRDETYNYHHGIPIIRALLKSFLPAANRELPILRGPLRGGRFYGNPRSSARKVLGIYEHELNSWLAAALPLASGLLDLGANDGYFTFGCAAAFRRAGKPARIVCFEPDAAYCAALDKGARAYRGSEIEIIVVPKFVGADSQLPNTVTLDSVPQRAMDRQARILIKIDVEGAELDVLRAAGHWLTNRNLFLIEVHAERLVEPIVRLMRAHGIDLRPIEQQPHWLLGREQRDADNRWLVSDVP